MSARRRERGAAAALGFAVLLASGLAVPSSCHDDADTRRTPPTNAGERTWPQGVVMAVDGVAIHAEEVDRASAIVQLVEPAVSSQQLRRLAFSNIVLPRAVARAMAPQKREAALREAQDKLAALRAGTDPTPPKSDGTIGTYVEGQFPELGLASWAAALDLEDGTWSEPIEDAGSFVLLRRIWRRDGPVPQATTVACDALRFDWLASDPISRRGELDRAIDAHRLQILDPAWREIVPELIQYRMGAR